jgi:hypothetical protein
MKRRYLCRACKCDDFEAFVDHDGGDGATAHEIFACFTCQELFYFMPDARPRPWALGIFEVYRDGSPKKASRR